MIQQGKKRVLVLGSGGREHALAWKLAQSPRCERLFVAPGNAGTAAWNVDLPLDDFTALITFAQEQLIDLTVVGPEVPLCRGIVDAFQAEGLAIFGPSRSAARLEGSKAFAKEIMVNARIPTAGYEAFTEKEAALAYLKNHGLPLVVKADGLAAGKGVVVSFQYQEAEQAIVQMLDGSLGAAGRRILLEDFLSGPEVSVFCLCDGTTVLPLLAVQDHKRVFNDDQGPNTGGMGAYGPPAFWTAELSRKIIETVAQPTLEAMRAAGAPFVGVLFLGLMLTEKGPYVLEYNVRFGDPETQILMAMLKSDLLPLLEACVQGRLAEQTPEWHDGSAVCVVMASPGYPGAYPQGIEIALPEAGEAEAVIFHAGTCLENGRYVSSGGRVLGVTARGSSLAEAQTRAYELVRAIDFPSAHFRTDIGSKGLLS